MPLHTVRTSLDSMPIWNKMPLQISTRIKIRSSFPLWETGFILFLNAQHFGQHCCVFKPAEQITFDLIYFNIHKAHYIIRNLYQGTAKPIHGPICSKQDHFLMLLIVYFTFFGALVCINYISEILEITFSASSLNFLR